MGNMKRAISYFMDNRLKDIRIKRGLTREALAEKINTSKGQIYQLETGRSRLSDVWLERLAPVLDVPQGALLRDGECFDLVDADLRKVPVLSGLELRRYQFAADPNEFKAMAEGIVYITYPHDNLVGFEVPDNSMNRVYPKGTIAITDFQNTDLEERAHYLVREGDELMVRSYRSNPIRFEAQSMLDDSDPIYPAKDTNVIGKVIAFQGDLQKVT